MTVATATGVVDLRPERADDAPFLRDLFASTAPDGIRSLAPLIDMQFRSREGTYRITHPHARFDIIEHGAERVGRIVFDASSPQAALVDWAFLPEHRGKGLGTAVLSALLAACADRVRSVDASVFHDNEASLHALRRLGFRIVDHSIPYVRLRWVPVPSGPSA